MSQGRLILLTDLDDTLFTSERALPAHAERAVMAAVNAEGHPLSFQTPQQQRLWQVLSPAADIIVPVTGRTHYALKRVKLQLRHRYSVVSHGALVISDEGIHPAWQAYLHDQLATARQTLAAAHGSLSAALQQSFPDVSCRVLEDMNIPVYLSLKAPDVLPEPLHMLLHTVANQYGLTLHTNRRNAALRPAYTCKATACTFLLEQVIQRQSHDTVIALGDSLSDLPFMGAGDMALVPTRSQIWDAVKEIAQ